MVKFNQRFDYYELLGIEPEDLLDLDLDDAERYVEKAYKETARRIHPDKVRVAGLSEAEAKEKQDEATAKFQELQKAYDVIKDPMQRGDYDLYRKKNFTPETFKPNLVPTEGLRFSGYSNEGRGFFKVYGDVFEKIYANEVAFQEEKKLPPDSVIKPPEIGDEHRPYPAVVQFYNYWLNFGTIMDFTWEDPHDEYDLAAAPTKKGVAVMRRKNIKARKRAKNEYNNKVRRKEFKSEKQCLNHEMSKKHRDMVAVLMGLKHRDLVEEVLELMEEEGDEDKEPEHDGVDEVLEGEGEEERESESEDEVSECVDENPKEEVGEEVVDGDEEEEEDKEDDEMEVLEAMVARRKTSVKVGEPIFEPMATIIDVEEDEVDMEHEETKNMDENGGEKKQRRRRSVKSTRINEHDDKKESKSDSSAESCVDNGSEDEQKRKKGGKKEKRSKRNTKSNGESEDSGVKNSKSSNRIRYAGKKSRGDFAKH
ncbi:DNAJ protein JJJ1 homolog [Rosa rugosa]|uniref:DNAJ protein JJJ1 homolog n=1 Tax=Rosa rugosa TaxID=74645 RepID=UPI002B40EE09|nr:DNAJ protein JJJ1 homolog [Rosa rugosa]